MLAEIGPGDDCLNSLSDLGNLHAECSLKWTKAISDPGIAGKRFKFFLDPVFNQLGVTTQVLEDLDGGGIS